MTMSKSKCGSRTGKGRRFSGQYADDGKAKRLKVREEAGHRCIRCGHPFESGKHGKGEWSPCDERCTHGGEVRAKRGFGEWQSFNVKDAVGELIKRGNMAEAKWRILTVHHLDGDKANDAWWNTLALCQRCHLEIQGKVDPRVPWMLEHSPWFKPFIGGFYALKYEGKNLSREEVMARLPELLAYEQLTAAKG